MIPRPARAPHDSAFSSPRWRALALCCALAGAPLLSGCLSMRARAYGGLTQTLLQGDLALDSSAGNLNLGANRVDLADELGTDDRELAPYVRAELALPLAAVTVSGFDYSETGRGTLASTHRFGDIPGGTQVTSHFELTSIKAAAHFDLIDLGIVRLAPGLGVDFLDFDLEVAELATANFERIDNEVFVPMVFAQAEADLGPVAATLDVGYMEASLEDARGSYLDVEALLRYSPLPLVEIFAGYRMIAVDVRGRADERRYEADLQLHGWMVGGGISF